MPDISSVVVFVYLSALTLLVGFGAHRLILTWRYVRLGEQQEQDTVGELPRVTVQLPMYNERWVARRLIAAAAALDWPRDRLQIQVLDDSTDETTGVVDDAVAAARANGHRIEVLRRDHRTGYKAGALEAGLAAASGELLAVFDADFVPAPDFLHRAVGCFQDPQVGMVQARWGHLNRASNALTAVQAVLLDGHFVVEQSARARGGAFFNFNGTAGVWRRTTIEAAGGWQHDTLTEDLDLSYRAQLAGWRFVYLAGLTADAEIPAEMQGFRSQQHRWAKGSIECLRKLAPQLIRARLPLGVRIEAFAHLTSNLSYVLILLLGVLMPLVVLLRAYGSAPTMPLFEGTLALVGLVSVALFYVVAQRRTGTSIGRALVMVAAVLALDVGLAVHKSRAVIEALLGYRTGFIRTPKFALTDQSTAVVLRPASARRSFAGMPEILLAVWSLLALLAIPVAPHPGWPAVPFLLLFLVGFGWVGLATQLRLRQGHTAVAAPATAH